MPLRSHNVLHRKWMHDPRGHLARGLINHRHNVIKMFKEKDSLSQWRSSGKLQDECQALWSITQVSEEDMMRVSQYIQRRNVELIRLCYYSNTKKQTFTVCIYKISSCQSYKASLSLHVQTNGRMENQWRRFKWKMFPSDSAAPLVKLDTGAAARRFALSAALLVILVMYQLWQENDNSKQRCQIRQRQSFTKAAQVYKNGE